MADRTEEGYFLIPVGSAQPLWLNLNVHHQDLRTALTILSHTYSNVFKITINTSYNGAGQQHSNF